MNTAQKYFKCPRINLIRPGGIHYMWPYYEKWLERACEYSLLDNDTPDKLREGLIDGSKLLAEIGSDDGAMAVAVLEVIETKEGNSLHVIALAGDNMSFWLDDFIEWLKATAKGLDCPAGVTLTGRRGWVNELKKYGFKYLYCNMRLEL